MNTRNRSRILALSVVIFFILPVSALLLKVGPYSNSPVNRHTPALAQSSDPPTPKPLILTDEQGSYPLGLHLEILEDPSGELTIEDVSSPEFDARFVPSQVSVPNYGYTDNVYWVRLHLENQTLQTNEWLLEQGFANTHFVDLYTPLPDGKGFAVKQTGVLRPATTRDVTYPHIVFKVPIPEKSQQTYYLRFQNGASMTLPLTLWTQAAFFSRSIIEQILNGIFYGALIGLLFYNLFLLFSLREASYLYLVAVLACLIIQDLSYEGYLSAYVSPHSDFLKKYAVTWSFSLLFASMILFSDSFLEIKTRLPVLHRVNLVTLAFWGALVILIPFISYHSAASLGVPLGLFTVLMVLVAGIVSWLGGFSSARFFIIAWFGMLASIFWVLLIRLGFLPSTIFSENIYRPGIVWMAVCWSIALADRINLLKSETEKANQELQKGENRLSQILEGMPVGVVLYGNDHKPKYANRRTIEILSDPERRIQPDPSMGRTLAKAIDYFSLKISGKGEPYPIENFPVFSALQGTPAFADDIEMDQGDKVVPLEIWASPIEDETGKVESAVTVFQDITQRKQAEAELVKYRKHLELLVADRTAELTAISRWLTALNEAQQSLTGKADLPQAYQKLSAVILQILNAAAVFFLRCDDQGEPCELHYRSHPKGSPAEDLVRRVKASFQPDPWLYEEMKAGKLVRLSSDQVAGLSAVFAECLQEVCDKPFVFAPMITHQLMVGALGVVLPEPGQELTPQQGALIEEMALDFANLIQNARLLDQVLELAMVEERNRLARDLHDSVTQVLFSASLIAEILPQRFRRNPEAALQSAAELQHMTRGALAEMRTLLLALRPAGLSKIPLGELLTQLTEAITSRTELTFHIYVDNLPPLPAEVQTAFYRIAQEALNNVIKHAQASQVILSLSAAPAFGARSLESWHGEIKMVLRDDGVGFDPTDRSIEHFGLGIMRERAAAIKAILNLESTSGKGTGVTLTWRKEEG